MGAIFSSTKKRAAPIEAESVASTKAVSPPGADHPVKSENKFSVQAPPLKRRRIDPHNEEDSALVPTAPKPPRFNPTAAVPSLPADSNRVIPRRYSKKKFALFLGYNGEQYYGMQVNPGVPTIEQVLMTTLYNTGMIFEQVDGQPSKLGLMRAARTDKGVSAVGQCVSLKLELSPSMLEDTNATVQTLNNCLPSDICVYGMLPCGMGFNARSQCHRRRYEYIYPLRLLGGPNVPQRTSDAPDAPDPRVSRFSSILKQFEGSHCFANFTDGLSSFDDTSRRYIIRVTCQQPFLPPGSTIFYVLVEVIGQSFLLHQIRKMVGLALVVYHGHAPEETIAVALSPHIPFSTPMAPAEGLLLDTLYFDQYNRSRRAYNEEPISDDSFAEAKQQFKSKTIYKRIAEKEQFGRVLETWVNVCNAKVSMPREKILELHQKFILTDAGQEEQRKAHIASLFTVRTDLQSFMDASEDNDICGFARELCSQFEERFGARATFLARAPGRVVLIGEHLDYNGFPVVSAAMLQGTMVAGCLENNDHIEVEHLQKDKYTEGQMEVNGTLISCANEKNDGRDERWLSYVAAGTCAFTKDLKGKRLVSGGGRILVGGNLPRAGGLASSSSLVSACALMAARMNRRRIPKLQLAALAAEGERGGTGTRGGSVDHVTSMCAEKGCVMEISFLPTMKVRALKWPEGARLFALDSHITAQKGMEGSVKEEFNLRAAECRLAAALLARRLDVHLAKTVTTPGQLMLSARKSPNLECKDVTTLRMHISLVMDRNEIVSIKDAQEELQVSDIELMNRFLAGSNAENFSIGKRMAHVFSEAERVESFSRVLGDEEMIVSSKIEILGAILNEGHQSLRNNYETSVATVDELVEFCLANGAVGSRMTGAGWGGYIINLVPDENAADFVKAAVSRVGEASVVEVLPWSGACVLPIHQAFSGPDRGRKRDADDSKEETGA